MSIDKDMIITLPLFLRKADIFHQLFKAESNQFEHLNGLIEDLNAQLSIDTATWALDLYESELKIITDHIKPLDERRSVIKSKLRGSGKVDSTLIKLVADAYTNGDVDVQFSGRIIVEFTSVRGIPPNIDDLKAVLEEIIPAHLPIEYLFRYLTWDELDAMALTWDEFDALELTWDELASYNPNNHVADDSLTLLFVE